MRNHTATHLLHAALRRVLGKHARQAGSLVAPDRLRFDFTHPHAMTPAELEQVEQLVNEAILANYPLVIDHKTRESAIEEGAMALFGETYAETVRTISIGDRERLSYELCGGTHVDETGVIGPFVLLGEGSVAAGIRRIEALTGRGALRHLQSRSETLAQVAAQLDTTPDRVNARLNDVLESFEELRREHASMRNRAAVAQYRASQVDRVADISVVAAEIKDAESEIMRALADTFRRDHPSGVAVFATTSESSVYLLATVSDDLVARGLHAGDLVKQIAAIVGGGGGGKATLAQAGGKNPEALPQALAAVTPWVQARAG
jgi:alanyl-tRNA synthetase